MADNYTQFSTILDVGTKENVAKALAIFNEWGKQHEEDGCLCFEIDNTDEEGPTELWLYDHEYGNPEDVVKYVTKIGKDLKLKGKWGFSWADTCSKPRLDEFGGGAVVVDLETGHDEWMITYHWLNEQLQGDKNEPQDAQEKFERLAKELFQLCEENNWGDPFQYGPRVKLLSEQQERLNKLKKGWLGLNILKKSWKEDKDYLTALETEAEATK
jgi:hypothetical protein